VTKEGKIYIAHEEDPTDKKCAEGDKLYYTKIGVTTQEGREGDRKRLAAIRTGNPREVTLRYTSITTLYYLQLERIIKEYFKKRKRHKRGEWFLLSEIDMMMLSDTIEGSLDFEWKKEDVKYLLEDFKNELEGVTV
tara:strand:- start:42 stop:449 length:408 start_codon:yes stop_codon:yes gene_type:complete